MSRERPETPYDADEEWRYERFILTIGELTDLTWIAAERAAEATLQTLGERLSHEQALELSADLPQDLRRWLLDAPPGAEPFSAHEFVGRVAVREKTSRQVAEDHVRAVFVALGRLVRHDELERLARWLGDDALGLLGDALATPHDPGLEPVRSYEEFVDRVAGRAGVDRPAAEHAIAATLETLAERISGGEVDDLERELPEELRPALERGKAQSGGRAHRMSLDEFVRRVAEREGVSYETALAHARAVFATLREAITEQELSDMLAQLPRAYVEALLRERPGAAVA